MVAVLMVPPYLQFFDDEGAPLSGGKVYTYTATGTFTTPKATYTTAAGDTEADNPVILDASGRPQSGGGSIWLSGTYDFKVTDSLDNTIETTLNVTAFNTLPSQSNAYFQSFSGNGSQTAFTTSSDLGSDEKAIYVWVDAGLTDKVGYQIQNPSAYTISGTTLTFGSPPAAGTGNIYVSAPSLLVGAASSSAADAAASAAAAMASEIAAATSEDNAADSEAAAAISAGQAAGYAAALSGTSTTSRAIGTGAKVFTTQANKQFINGQYLIIASAANNANYMHGTVTSYSGTTLTMNITDIGGTGTLADWNISLSGTQGPIGATGPAGGNLILLSSQTASSSASINFDNTLITNTYANYLIIINNAIPATLNSVLYIKLSLNNGSAFLGTCYSHTSIPQSNSTSYAGVANAGVNYMQVSATTTGSSSSSYSGAVNIYSTSVNTVVTGVGATLEDASHGYQSNLNGIVINGSIINYLSFVMSSGNITSGTFKLYGIL